MMPQSRIPGERPLSPYSERSPHRRGSTRRGMQTLQWETLGFTTGIGEIAGS